MSEHPERATGTRPRPGGRTARVRDQVLRATVELVAQHGLEGLQYDEIARTAGVNRATVHRNWPLRDQLVVEALSRFAEESIPVRDTGDIHADLTDLVCAIAKVGESPVGQALVRAAMYSGEGSAIRDLGQQTLDRRLPMLQERLDRAVASGELPCVDASFLNVMLSGPVHLHLTRQRRPFERADARRIVELVLAGVRAMGGTP